MGLQLMYKGGPGREDGPQPGAATEQHMPKNALIKACLEDLRKSIHGVTLQSTPNST